MKTYKATAVTAAIALIAVAIATRTEMGRTLLRIDG